MKFWKILAISLILSFTVIFFPRAEEPQVLRLYIDADRTGVSASGRSIEQGIRLALSEINYRIGDYSLEPVIKDHRGNSRRSTLHINQYLKDPQGLAIFCGLHSPPVLANLKLINSKGVLLLDPWAAAGPITRSPASDGKNWVFRLSVDDTKAGEVITSYAIDREGFKRPILLLEDTGWGRSNRRNMLTALSKRGITPDRVIFFDWNIGEAGAREILADIWKLKADVIFMVANAPEGKTFVKAMAEREPEDRLPIRSHWGITGGDFFESLGPAILTREVDLKFIQTSFSFINSPLSPFAEDVLKRAVNLFPDINGAADIKAPCGFIHGYDLTRILIEALKEVELTGRIEEDRELVRKRLESLKRPVKGLIKNYRRPFGPYSAADNSAHEALNIDDFRMAFYLKNGTIRVIEQ